MLAAASACLTTATFAEVILTTKIDLHAGPSGYYIFDGLQGPSPDINATVGDVLVFEQIHPSNYYHPLGFAYHPGTTPRH